MLTNLKFLILLLAVSTMCGGCSIVSLRVVEDGTGAPINEANVTFASSDGKEKSLGKTDAAGSIMIAPGGQGTIVISKPGFQTFKQDFASLSAGASFDSDIEVRLVHEGREPSGFDKSNFPKFEKEDFKEDFSK
ncbi:MAG: carboxypeptidase regulatory-like domain-containing protein [Planctomycetaceae bacterium]|nr:MAG: carboxypeptidase regulatory-like domain-containing protein [Planctomycetaceae bacterium]